MSTTREQIEKDLDMAQNRAGGLSEGMKHLIFEYLENPTMKLWDRIRMTVLAIDRNDTNPKTQEMYLWRAIINIDPTFPHLRPKEELVRDENEKLVERRIWSRIPSPELVKRAIEWSTH